MKKFLELKYLETKHIPPTHASSSPPPPPQEIIEHIQAGSLYEVDHTKLPLTTPEHFKPIRVVMVNGKSLYKVSVSFPSLDALSSHMNEEKSDGFSEKLLPELDEKHSLLPQIASDVFYRRIPREEISQKSDTWSFWRIPRESCCLSETMKQSGLVQWGKRKAVRFLMKHENPKRECKAITKRQNKLVEARWAENRYKSAEENILKVLKAKRAYADNPILRGPLRAEARKVIGDTGLIDHLLKNMSGKVAPGGVERFRRRHNANGVLEYWLESAELMRIREEAGVEDQSWTPPPGWKLGDSPTQDPNCVRMFKEIQHEIENLKKEKQQEETSCDQGQAHNVEDKYRNLLFKKSKIEELMLQLSESFSGIEEDLRSLLEHMEVLKPTTEEQSLVYSESAEAPMLESEDNEGGRSTKAKIGSRDKATTTTSPEDKAAKIERLRSSFRLCKPHGTFLSPNMMSMSPKDADSFWVPTPPSVSSSNNRLVLESPHGYNPASPLKPLAERRAISISTLSSIVTPLSPIGINLNELPSTYK